MILVLVTVFVYCWLSFSCVSAVVGSRFDCCGLVCCYWLIVLLWFTTGFVLVAV